MLVFVLTRAQLLNYSSANHLFLLHYKDKASISMLSWAIFDIMRDLQIVTEVCNHV